MCYNILVWWFCTVQKTSCATNHRAESYLVDPIASYESKWGRSNKQWPLSTLLTIMQRGIVLAGECWPTGRPLITLPPLSGNHCYDKHVLWPQYEHILTVISFGTHKRQTCHILIAQMTWHGVLLYRYMWRSCSQVVPLPVGLSSMALTQGPQWRHKELTKIPTVSHAAHPAWKPNHSGTTRSITLPTKHWLPPLPGQQ